MKNLIKRLIATYLIILFSASLFPSGDVYAKSYPSEAVSLAATSKTAQIKETAKKAIKKKLQTLYKNYVKKKKKIRSEMIAYRDYRTQLAHMNYSWDSYNKDFQFCYSYTDLDKDGICELLVCEEYSCFNLSYGPENEYNYPSKYAEFNIYKYSDGKVKSVLKGGPVNLFDDYFCRDSEDCRPEFLDDYKFLLFRGTEHASGQYMNLYIYRWSGISYKMVGIELAHDEWTTFHLYDKNTQALEECNWDEYSEYLERVKDKKKSSVTWKVYKPNAKIKKPAAETVNEALLTYAKNKGYIQNPSDDKYYLFDLDGDKDMELIVKTYDTLTVMDYYNNTVTEILHEESRDAYYYPETKVISSSLYAGRWGHVYHYTFKKNSAHEKCATEWTENETAGNRVDGKFVSDDEYMLVRNKIEGEGSSLEIVGS